MARYVGWKELYENLRVHGAYPLAKLPSVLSEVFKTRETVHLDFGGIDQLSDEVFYVLKECLQVWQKACVVEVKCVGCHRLTDNGIELLAQSFFNLKRINLDGCSQLTERSLCYLGRFCSQLSSVSMVNTDLSTIPLDFHSELPIRLDGCPLYRPLYRSVATGNGSPVVVTAKSAHSMLEHSDENVKVVILTTQVVRWNITNYIRTGKMEKLDADRDVLQTSYTSPMNGKQVNLNVFEIHAVDPAVYAPFVTDGAIYFVVIELEHSEYHLNEIMNRIDFIRAIALQAPIIILALYGTQRTRNVVETIADDLRTMFQEQEKNLDEHLEKENYRNEKVLDKDFAHQQRYVQSLRCRQKCNYSISYICVATPFQSVENEVSNALFEANKQLKVLSNKAGKLAKPVEQKQKVVQKNAELADFSDRMSTARNVLEQHFSKRVAPTNVEQLPIQITEILSVQQESATQLMEEYWELNEWKNAIDALDRATLKDMVEATQLNISLSPTWPKVNAEDASSINVVYQCIINSMLTLTRQEYDASPPPPPQLQMKKAPMKFKKAASKAMTEDVDMNDLFGDSDEPKSTWWQHVSTIITDTGFIRKLKKFRPKQNIGVSMKVTIDPWISVVEQHLEENTIRQTGIASIWLWVKAMHSYLVIMMREEKEEIARKSIALQQNFENASSVHQLISAKMAQAYGELRQIFHQWDHNQLPEKVAKFFLSVLDKNGPLGSKKILTADELLEALKADVSSTFGNDKRAACHALQRLGRSGRLILYDGKENGTPSSFVDKSLYIIRDLDAFMQFSNALQHAVEHPEYANGNRVLSVARFTPLFSEQLLTAAIRKCNYSEAEVGMVKDLTLNAGWLVKCGVYDEQQFCTVPHYFSSLHLSSRPFLRQSKDKVHDDARFNQLIFPNYRNENANPSDVDLVFSFKFRQGMSSNLFQLILSEAFNIPGWYALMAWQSGALIQCSCAELFISYKMHGSMSSGAIELTARTTRFVSSYTSATDYVVRDYLWSVMSVFVLLIEGIINKFPVMHHKLRYTCRGQCYNEGSGETYSPVQIPRTLHELPFCEKCKNYHSDQCNWSFYHGRRFFLPFHDWSDDSVAQKINGENPDESEPTTTCCAHCRMTRQQIRKLYLNQVITYPPFASDCFELSDPVSCPDVTLRGSLLLGTNENDSDARTSKSRPSTANARGRSVAVTDEPNHVFVRTMRTLKYHEFEQVRLTVLKTAGEWELNIVKRLDFDLNFSSPAIANHWNMKKVLQMKIKHGQVLEVQVYNAQTMRDELLTVDANLEVGDKLEIYVLGNVENESEDLDADTLLDRMAIFKNGQKLFNFVVPQECYFVLQGTLTQSEASGPLWILDAPDCPVVTADHFAPGMLLLFKTQVGNWWMPGVIKRIQNGLLYVSELSKVNDRKDSGQHAFETTSRSICPIGLYPDEINVSGEMTFDFWFNFLRDHRQTIATPFGLFNSAFRRNKMFRELPTRHFSSRTCTLSCNSEQVLRSQLTNMIEPNLYISRSQTHFVFLPRTDPLAFFLPSRQFAHKWTALSMNYLCNGLPFGKTANTDTHLLNTTAAVSDSIDTRVLLMALLPSIANCLATILRGPITINKWDKLFPEMKQDDISDTVVGRLVWQYLRIYKLTLGLLVACTAPNLKELSFNAFDKDTMQVVLKDEKLKDEQASKDFWAQHFNWVRQNMPADCFAIELEEDGATKKGSNKKRAVSNQCPLHFLLAQQSQWPTLVTQPLDPVYKDSAYHVKVVNFESLPLLKTMPVSLVQNFNNLVSINLTDSGMESVNGIGSVCPKLKSLFISGNRITKLDGDFAQLASRLRNLQLAGNPLIELPANLSDFKNLRMLHVSDTELQSLPERLPASLKTLDISRTRIKSVVSLPKGLEQFNAAGVAMPSPSPGNQPHYTWEAIEKWMDEVKCDRFGVSKSTVQALFDKHDVNKSQVVEEDSLRPFEVELFQLFPRFGLPITPENETAHRFPEAILNCTHMRRINLSYHAIRDVPDRIGRLRKLELLVLTGCPYLENVSGEVGKTQIHKLGLTGCPSLKTPPLEIVRQGMNSTLAYLKRLSSGSVECFRTKLMFVGLGGAGKTSLLRSLMSSNNRATNIENEGITDGIQISSWSVPLPNKKAMTFSVWDFAGQTLYYNTHQFFITNRAVYLLIWNIRLGYEHAGLQFWLSSVKCHAPDAPIFVVGTHCDQVAMTELNEEDIRAKFPQIVGFYSISSGTGEGIQKLREDLIQTTMKQPYVGERVPEAWLNFEQVVLQKRAEVSFLSWSEVNSLALTSAIYDQEVHQAVGFLHQLGSVQHFDSELLRGVVVINPQWIVDVMACLVSVHNNVIVDGRLKHQDVSVIWKSYPKSLHSWLLSLTEAFDLTFPLADEHVSIVPCLLPVEQPGNISWQDYDSSELKQRNIRETKIVYRFDYLPPGLFNRVQVRLCQFSKKSAVWKRGSLMNKAGHDALMTMIDENDVLIRVQGPRPENFLLLVHEVFEGLINEAFSGVTYEYYIPCYDCLDSGTKEPAMFSGKVLRRAVERKALFLQCHTLFHTLGVADMQSMMPPETNTDFTLQLEATIKDLERYRKGKPKLIDSFMLYNPDDLPENEEEESVLHAKKLQTDLEKMGIRVLVLKDLLNVSVAEIARTLQTCALIIVFMTKNFPHTEQCVRIFEHVINTKKKIQLVLADSSNDWRLSAIAPSLAGELYVDFSKRAMYQKKLEDLKHSIEGKLHIQKSAPEESYDVFISYCWSNSRNALEQTNSKEIPGAIGEMDPRELKKFFVQNNLVCWMDIDKLGSAPLYQDIVSGLNKSKVMVVCISDQYAASMACQTEFRYGHLILHIPMVIVCVAANINWQNTEIGMLSLNHPRVNLQIASEENKQDLLRLIKTKVAEQVEKSKQQSVAQGSQEEPEQNSAFMELYEVAQRKLFRLISSFITQSLDAEPFPLVFTLDVPSDTELTAGGLPNSLNMSLLCEYEGGWHVPPEQIPYKLKLARGIFLKMTRVSEGFAMKKQDEVDVQKFIKLTAPLFAMTTLILRNSDSTNLNLMKLYEASHPAAINLFTFYEDTMAKMHEGSIKVFIKLLYLVVRNYLLALENNRLDQDMPASLRFGGLRRCRMTNGKISWLCAAHRNMKSLRASVLDDSYQNEGNLNKFEQYEQLRNQGSGSGHEEQNCLLNLSNAWQGEMINLSGPEGKASSPVRQPVSHTASNSTAAESSAENKRKTPEPPAQPVVQPAAKQAESSTSTSNQPSPPKVEKTNSAAAAPAAIISKPKSAEKTDAAVASKKPQTPTETGKPQVQIKPPSKQSKVCSLS